MEDAPLVWPNAVEALFLRALKGRVSPGLGQKLRGLGIDLEKPLLPAYPWETWIAAVDATAIELYPDRSPAEANFELGKQTIISYQETLVGKAIFVALRLASPRKVLDRLSRSFRTSNNYTQTKLTDIAPGEVDVWFNRVEPQASFTQGVLAEGLPAAGIPNVRVKMMGRDGLAATFRVQWDV